MSDLAELLSEGLDLCVRARKLDDQVERAMRAGMGERFPGGTRCATPAMWVQKLYDRDLAAWEARARKALMSVVDGRESGMAGPNAQPHRKVSAENGDNT